jgi:hypothetical protein
VKKKYILFLAISCTFLSCTDIGIKKKPVTVTLNFTHNWNGTEITSADFNDLKFTNANGEILSIERLRYLLSNITLGSGETKAYNLVNMGENRGLEIVFENITIGIHNLNFVFGFTDEDNTDGVYTDLNSDSFNVPGMLGGGYHFMQFDGIYLNTIDEEVGFNYHAIRAVDRTDPNNLVFEDTSFNVDLGAIGIINDATIEVKMNIAEWFKNPNTWTLNALNTVLMPNFEAQKMMSANGKTVFSLGEIIQ